MVIAVNTRLLLAGKMEGIGWFAYENLKRITVNHPEHQFIFIFDRKYDEKFIFSNNITPVVANPQARHPFLWYLFFDWAIPPILRKYKADLFFSPDGWLSQRTNVPSLPVIHDLNFFHEPQWVAKWPRWYYHKFFPKFIQKASRIATVSKFSKEDIANRFQYPEQKIDVVYNGANENYYPLTDGVKLETRKNYAQGEEYFLFVGLVHPRKNLTRILKAFDAFKKKNSSKTKLIVVGSTAYWTEDTRMAYENSTFRNDILFVGRLEPEELHKIMGSALALVFTTLFEGFGIPILEAMYCNTPVITSNVTSMPEIGGEAVLYADPHSVDSISDAMIKIACDDELRQKLVLKGEEQRLKFSWDASSKLVWKSITDTMKNATL